MTHLPFANRKEAGRALAAELGSHAIPRDAVVLSLARGGVSVGIEIANRMSLPLDVVVVRKIGVPWQPELAMGALAGNVRVLDLRLIAELDISASDLHQATDREQVEARRREELYRSGKPPLNAQGKTAIIVDDGLATGSTTLAAIRYVKSQTPFKMILAIPVASRSGYSRVRREVDDAVCLAIPEDFIAVSQWYREFPQLSDEDVRSILAQNRILN